MRDRLFQGMQIRFTCYEGFLSLCNALMNSREFSQQDHRNAFIITASLFDGEEPVRLPMQLTALSFKDNDPSNPVFEITGRLFGPEGENLGLWRGAVDTEKGKAWLACANLDYL